MIINRYQKEQLRVAASETFGVLVDCVLESGSSDPRAPIQYHERDGGLWMPKRFHGRRGFLSCQLSDGVKLQLSEHLWGYNPTRTLWEVFSTVVIDDNRTSVLIKDYGDIKDYEGLAARQGPISGMAFENRIPRELIEADVQEMIDRMETVSKQVLHFAMDFATAKPQ